MKAKNSKMKQFMAEEAKEPMHAKGMPPQKYADGGMVGCYKQKTASRDYGKKGR